MSNFVLLQLFSSEVVSVDTAPGEISAHVARNISQPQIIWKLGLMAPQAATTELLVAG
jgi:hypothetical protein